MSTSPKPMSARVEELWSVLQREVVWLHGRWIMYRQLYGTSPERIGVLNASAGTFFQVLNQTLLHEIQLSLSKLGDPADSGPKKQNLTLRALLQVIEGDWPADPVLNEIEGHLEFFDQACERLRVRRNKWIAHFDRKTMLDAQVVPLEGPSRAEIEEALSSLRAVLNAVQFFYQGSTTAYELFAMNADGDALIATLRQGLRYEQLVKERVIAHDDLRRALKSGA